MIRLAPHLTARHGYLASRRARRLNNRPPGRPSKFAAICSPRRAAHGPAPQGNTT